MNKFDIDLDSVVLTSTYILVDKQPILHVIYEDDGSGISWQFHCGNGDYSMDNSFSILSGYSCFRCNN